jgi:hypothetical protein
MTMPRGGRAEDRMMLTYFGQHRLYISATKQKQYLYRGPGNLLQKTDLPWSIWQVVRNIAINSAKSIPHLSRRNTWCKLPWLD